MAEMWYYTTEGKQMDPVTMKELRRLVSDGTLQPTDMVWKEGMARWIRASSLTELFPDPISALDKYFTNTAEPEKKNSQTTSVTAPAGRNSTATTEAPAKKGGAPPAEDDTQPKTKRKTSESEEEEDSSRPPKRRAEAKGGSGGVFIVVFLLLGAFVLLGGLVGGVVILIMLTRGGTPNNVIKGEKNYTVNLAPNESDNQKFTFRKGIDYTITVKTEPRAPGIDVDLFVWSKDNNKEAWDDGIDPDCFVRFTPREDGEFRVEVLNFAGGRNVQSTVTIREVPKDLPVPKDQLPKDQPKDGPKNPPLPPNVKEGSGSFDTQQLIKPGKAIFYKFRVKAGHQASFKATPIVPGPLTDINIIVTKENDPNAIIAEDRRPDPNASVSFNLPNTEIVRVIIQNASKASSHRVAVNYNASP